MASENKALKLNFLKKQNANNYTFIIRKDSNFCDQILQVVAILGKMLKIFIFISFNFFFFINYFPL